MRECGRAFVKGRKENDPRIVVFGFVWTIFKGWWKGGERKGSRKGRVLSGFATRRAVSFVGVAKTETGKAMMTSEWKGR